MKEAAEVANLQVETNLRHFLPILTCNKPNFCPLSQQLAANIFNFLKKVSPKHFLAMPGVDTLWLNLHLCSTYNVPCAVWSHNLSFQLTCLNNLSIYVMAPNLTCRNNLSIYALCFHNQAGYGGLWGGVESITTTLINDKPLPYSESTHTWCNSVPISWRKCKVNLICKLVCRYDGYGGGGGHH